MTRLRLAFLLVFLTACSLPVQTPLPASAPTEGLAAAPAPVSTPTPLPTPVPEAPLGTDENPIVMALLPGREPPEAAQDVTTQLSLITGLTIVPYVPASYLSLIEDLGAGRVHVAWLSPFPYLLAHEKGYADAALASIVLGHDLSAAQFLVNQEMVSARIFTVYFDPLTGQNLTDAATALKQFADKKPCWPDAYSATGYIVPLGILNESGIPVRTGAFVQGHATVVKALYSDPQGAICQFGAAIADHQIFLAAGYENVTEKVVTVWQSEPIVPFDAVVYAPSLPDGMRVSISGAFLSMMQTEEGNAALRDTYQIDGLKLIDDTFYNPLRKILEASGVPLSTLVK